MCFANAMTALGPTGISTGYKSEPEQAFPYGHGRPIESESHLH